MKIQPYVYSLCLECSLCCISIVYIHIPTDCVSKKCILIHNFTLAKQTLKTVCSPEMSMSEWYLTLRSPAHGYTGSWRSEIWICISTSMSYVMYYTTGYSNTGGRHCIVLLNINIWVERLWNELNLSIQTIKKGVCNDFQITIII